MTMDSPSCRMVLDADDRDPTHAVEAGDHRVAAGFVGADLLTLVKREERDAHVLVLRQRAADDLTGLIGDLIAQGQDLCLADIFHTVHDNFLLLKRTALAAAHDIISYHAPFYEKRQRLFCFVRQHTVPLAVFDVKHAELHGEGLDLNVLIAELRELVEQ